MRVKDVVLEVDRFGSTEIHTETQKMFARKLNSRERYHVVIEGSIYELSKVAFIQFLRGLMVCKKI